MFTSATIFLKKGLAFIHTNRTVYLRSARCTFSGRVAVVSFRPGRAALAARLIAVPADDAAIMEKTALEDHRWLEDMECSTNCCVCGGLENGRNCESTRCPSALDFDRLRTHPRCCCRLHATGCGLDTPGVVRLAPAGYTKAFVIK